MRAKYTVLLPAPPESAAASARSCAAVWRQLRVVSAVMRGDRRGAGRIAVVACSAGDAVLAPAARAHESRPAYLEIKETAPGQFSRAVAHAGAGGHALPLVLKMPDGVRDLKEPVVQELTDSLVERRWIDAGRTGSPASASRSSGFSCTITDVLVRVELLDGRTLQTIVRPSQPWVEIAASQSGGR